MINNLRKTKIIATIGPSTNTYKGLKNLISNGLDMIRINFSHGNFIEHEERLKIIKEIFNKDNLYVGLLADLSGPKIRIGTFINKGIEVSKGQTFEVTNEEMIGNDKKFYINYEGICRDLKIGDKFSLDDGLLNLKVIDKKKENLIVEALNSHYLTGKKGLNAPGINLKNEYLSKKDIADLKFIAKHPFNYVAASFVRTKEDILEIKNILANLKRKDLKIISKIETLQAINNIDEIIEQSDAILIARGDLAIEVGISEVPLLQKEIIKKANLAGKPVIVATHMLESMTTKIIPTRAEVSDVANAIFDGTDLLMLSGETAIGNYPYEAYSRQDEIAIKTEQKVPYIEFTKRFFDNSNKSQGDAIALAVANVCNLLDIEAIFIFSESMNVIEKLAKFKFKAPIIAPVYQLEQAKSLKGLYYGIHPFLLTKNGEEENHQLIKKIAKELKFPMDGKYIVIKSDIKIKKINALEVVTLR